MDNELEEIAIDIVVDDGTELQTEVQGDFLKGEKGDKGNAGEKGEKGDIGATGCSAYELYLQSLPEGEIALSQEQWLLSLNGNNYYQEYKTTYMTVEPNPTIVPINIDVYNEDCILEVYKDGARLVEETDYIIKYMEESERLIGYENVEYAVILTEGLPGVIIHLIVLNTVKDVENDKSQLLEEINEIKIQIPKAIAEGKELHLEDSADKLEAQISVKGNAEQKTREGRNLFNIDNRRVEEGAEVDEDGFITLTADNTNGTGRMYVNCFTSNLDLETSTDYNIIFEIKNVTGTGVLNLVGGTDSTQTQFTTLDKQSFNALAEKPIVQSINTTKSEFDSRIVWGLRTFAMFEIGESGSITFRISVLKDTTITADTFEYEAYGVSPSVEYPSEIQTVQGSVNIIVSDKDKQQSQNIILPLQKEFAKVGDYSDTFVNIEGNWYEKHYIGKIESYNGETIETEYISTTRELSIGATIYYVLNEPELINCTAEQVIALNQVVETYKKITNIETDTIAILEVEYYQDIETICNQQQSGAVIDENYVHTDNNYTTEEKNKLQGLENYDDTEVKNTIATNYEAIMQSIGEINQFELAVIEELPTTEIDLHTIYLISKESSSSQDVYDEYIYINEKWEHIGSTQVDLNDYYKKTELDSKFDSMLQKVFPIGSRYVTQSAEENPSSILGFGEWERFNGLVALGVDDTDENMNTIGQTGGLKEVALEIKHIPAHNHPLGYKSAAVGSGSANWNIAGSDRTGTNNDVIQSVGEGESHPNIQPYEVVGYMWIRRA